MARKEKNDYFQMIEEQVAHARDAARLLNEILTDFRPNELPANRARMHEIEHGADIKKHDMMEKLIREFITPIEREDLRDMSEEIDTVTDLIEDVLNKIYIYNVAKMRPEALEFAALILRSCDDLVAIAQRLGDFRKNREEIGHGIVEVNRLEEDGDRLYIECMARLFRSEREFAPLMAWHDLFSCLEQCLDTCEHVANVFEGVILKTI